MLWLNRLIAMNQSRITKHVFTWFDDHSEINWCMDIKRVSTELGMLHMTANWFLILDRLRRSAGS